MCGVQSFNFCCVLLYMIWTLMMAVQRYVMIGFEIQKKIQGTIIKEPPIFIVANACLAAYYIVGIWISFLSYWEFKAMTILGDGY